MKVSEHNQMIKYITDPKDRKSPEERAKITATQKANDVKRVAAKRKEYGLPDMHKHVVDTLNKYEDGPDIIQQVVDYAPNKVDRTTMADRIAAEKQMKKVALQPNHNGKLFQQLVKDDEAAYKKAQEYPNEATPEQMATLAYNMEKSRQMTGGDGRYDKPKTVIKKNNKSEKLFENIFDKNGLRINSKKPITEKMKSNREVIKSIQPLNVDRYLEIRNAEPAPTKRIEPIRQEDPDMKQGIGALYKST